MNRSVASALRSLGPVVIPIVVGAAVLGHLLENRSVRRTVGHHGPLSTSVAMQLVRRLFADLVGRPPSATELAAARGLRRLGRGRVVGAVFDGAPARGHRVGSAYEALLSRAPTRAELARWLTRPSGGNGERVVAGITASSEYFRFRGRSLPRAYLRALYGDLTGSPPVPEAEALPVRSLRRRAFRASLVSRVERSDARLSRLVNQDYLLVFHRHADPGGAATYRAVLKSGSPNERVVTDLLESDEYLADASARAASAP